MNNSRLQRYTYIISNGFMKKGYLEVLYCFIRKVVTTEKLFQPDFGLLAFM